MLKCQFHCHSGPELFDNINYSAEELIERAAKLNYEVLSFTHHRRLFFTEEIRKYAEKHEILLIPGIEFEINKRHILGINIDKEIEKVDSYKKLKEYKKSHPNCLIMAAHPFFPGTTTLGKDLVKNIELFDAIENSFCYTKKINFNKKAEKVAKKYNKRFIATSDCHVIKYLDLGYVMVDAEKNTPSIIKAIKAGKTKNHHSPITLFKVFQIISTINLRNIYKKIFKK